MSTKQTTIALGLGIALSAVSVPAVGQDSSYVVAEIAGRKVTAEELGEKEAGNCFRPDTNIILPSAMPSSITSTISCWNCRRRKNL